MCSPDDNATCFRVLRGGPPPDVPTPAYTNRHGVTFYLHETRDRLGRFMYIARRAVQDGALGSMPLGFDFVEHLSGRVSVRRIRGGRYLVPVADLQLVRAVVARQPALAEHIAERTSDSILIYEPDPEPVAAAGRGRGEAPVFTLRGPPFVRAAMAFEVVRGHSTGGVTIYDAVGPTHAMDLRWTRLGRGRIVDLAVRFVPMLHDGPRG